MRKADSAFVVLSYQLELIIVVCVVGLCGTAYILFNLVTLHKAAMTEPINLMEPLQEAVIERLALAGQLDDFAAEELVFARGKAQSGTNPRSNLIASAKGLEEANASLARMEAAAAEIEGLGKRRSASSNAVVGLSDGVPMAVVASGFLNTPSIVEFRPVVNPDAPAVVNWLCGKQQEFAGIKARPPREPAVPDNFLPFPCRNRQ